MEQHTFNRFPIIGFVLVLLGVALLLNQMSVIHIGGWALCGSDSCLRCGGCSPSFISNDRSKVFFGTLCFLPASLLFAEGGLFTARSQYTFRRLSSSGIAFFMLFVFNVKDWHLLSRQLFFSALAQH